MDRRRWRVPHRLGAGYQIYLAQDRTGLIILLGGGPKRRQRAGIARAKALFEEYKARKAAVARPRGGR